MSKRFAVTLIALAFIGGLLVADLWHHNTAAYAQEGKDSKTPKWQHGLMLRARKGDEDNFTKDTKRFGVEVFEDANNGNVVYITETGSIAVVKK
jgi:hypothetical protein